MSRYNFLLSITLTFHFFISTTCAQEIPNWEWNKVVSDTINPIENPGVDLTNKNKYNKTLFKSCLFTEGLNIKGIDSVYFYGCTFTGFGVKLGNRTTHSIIFDSCTFKNLTANGIVTNIDDFSDHYSLVIKNSHFENWGIHDGIPICNTSNRCNPNMQNCERCNDQYNKFDHAIYLRATDALIKNCTFYHTIGGPAISVRNSAQIVGNTIYSNKTGVGGALGYWTQYKARGSRTLLVDGNTFIENAQNKTLIQKDNDCDCGNSFQSLVTVTNFDSTMAVSKVIIRFNTLIMLDSIENPDHRILTISDKFKKNQLDIYGNLLADFRDFPQFTGMVSIDSLTNLTTTSRENFIRLDQENLPYNPQLTNNGEAYNYLALSRLIEGASLTESSIGKSSVKISVGAHQYDDNEN